MFSHKKTYYNNSDNMRLHTKGVIQTNSIHAYRCPWMSHALIHSPALAQLLKMHAAIQAHNIVLPTRFPFLCAAVRDLVDNNKQVYSYLTAGCLAVVPWMQVGWLGEGPASLSQRRLATCLRTDKHTCPTRASLHFFLSAHFSSCETSTLLSCLTVEVPIWKCTLVCELYSHLMPPGCL